MIAHTRSAHPRSTDCLSRIGIGALVLFFGAIAWPTHSLGQSVGTLPVGTPVRVELYSDTTALLSSGTGAVPQTTGAAFVEGTFQGFYGDRVRILDPQSGETVILNRGEVKGVWAITRWQVRSRAAEGFAFGALLGGGLSYAVLSHNGASGSCSSSGLPVGRTVCSAARSVKALAMAGGVVVGGLIGALLGSRVKVERDGTVLIPLPDRSGPALPNVRLRFTISNK